MIHLLPAGPGSAGWSRDVDLLWNFADASLALGAPAMSDEGSGLEMCRVGFEMV